MTIQEAYYIFYGPTTKEITREVIEKELTKEIVIKDYRKLSKKYHPDLNKGKEKESSEKMKLINVAKEVLLDACKLVTNKENKENEENKKSEAHKTVSGLLHATYNELEELIPAYLKIVNYAFKLREYKIKTDLYKNAKYYCEEIKNSDFIKTIFSYILTVGNIMNGGSNQGQADGFNLDILPKLSSIKDNRNKTLLQYICTTMKEQTGRDYTNFKRNFENVKEAAMNIFNESQTILNTIKKGAKEASTAITAITIDDVFMKRAKDLVNKANTEIEKTAKKFEEVEKNCQALIKNFGYEEKDAKYNKIEEFFKLFNNFFEDVDRAMPKEELKKVYNRKHEVGTKIDECRSSLMNELKSGKVQLKKKV